MSVACLTIVVGAERYAVDVERVLEIAELGELTPVPGAPGPVQGVCNVRGEVLPVLSMARLLGIGDGASATRMVVAEDAGVRCALAVDQVCDVGPTPTLTEQTELPLLDGAALVGDSLVGMVNLPALLSAVQIGS